MKSYLKRVLQGIVSLFYARHFCNRPKYFKKMGRIHNDRCRITAGDNCGFWRNVSFNCGEVSFGNNCVIGENCIFFSTPSKNGGGITIGNDVMIASNCSFYDSDHGMKKGLTMNSQKSRVSPIVIENDVWIGTGAIILRGSHIHQGAVIGAGSVVKGDIPENAIAVGIPCKVMKYRED